MGMRLVNNDINNIIARLDKKNVCIGYPLPHISTMVYPLCMYLELFIIERFVSHISTISVQ